MSARLKVRYNTLRMLLRQGLWIDIRKGAKVDVTQHLLSSAAPTTAAPSQNGSKKRTASATPPAPSQDKRPKIKEEAKVGDGQNAKSKSMSVPVDEYCPLGHYQVYIDPDGTIYDASLNQTNSGHNNSKKYAYTNFA